MSDAARVADARTRKRSASPPEATTVEDAAAAPAPEVETDAGAAEGDARPDRATDAGAAAQAVSAQELCGRVEAALIASDRPLPAARLAEALGRVKPAAVQAAVDSLNGHYQQTGRSFRIESVAGGWQILTLPCFADTLQKLQRTRASMRLSPAALETLAIVAYKQPILRADIESVRGVACGEVLRSLMERHLVKIVGRAEELGRPMLYGTTKSFLEVFGLASLKDLPGVEEFKPKV